MFVVAWLTPTPPTLCDSLNDLERHVYSLYSVLESSVAYLYLCDFFWWLGRSREEGNALRT